MMMMMMMMMMMICLATGLHPDPLGEELTALARPSS